MERIISRILIGSAMLCLSLSISAQSINTTAEDFDIGMHLVFQTCQSEGVKIYPGEKDIAWDYSNLEKIENDTTTEDIIAPSKTPFGEIYAGANIVEQYSDSKLVFIKKTNKSSYLLGYIDTVNGMKAKYEIPILIAQRPIAVGQKVVDSFTTAYSIRNMDFKGSGKVIIEAEGPGTLVLPNGTYKDAIRIKISQTQHDLLVQYSSQVKTQIITYVWFDNKHKSALLKITEVTSSNFSNKSVEYLLKERK